MKKYLVIFICATFLHIHAMEVPQRVPLQVMQTIYQKVKTPYKFGLVLAPKNNHYKIDCPTVFHVKSKWYMSYLIYNGEKGKDGRGYETWLATSNDLLHWHTLGRILAYPKGNVWDENQRAGYIALINYKWGGNYHAQLFNGKHWMSYFGGNTRGYEMGTLKEGMAFTTGDIAKAHEWNTLGHPILSPTDSDRGWWEDVTQYKSTVLWDKSKKLGYPFVMYYNAGGIDPINKVKAERIGIALSNDMIHWVRYEHNPIFTHAEGITGDPVIQKIGKVYAMFYYSAFRKSRPYKAFNTFACSYDLVHWTDWTGPDLIIPSEPYDNLFAHKSYVVNWKGVVYHFYCAVDVHNQRGIAVATSKNMGTSTVEFPKPDESTFRKKLSLDADWLTAENDTNRNAYDGFENPAYKPIRWQHVDVPHNWDTYQGTRRLKHGNKHGYAWYRKSFEIKNQGTDKEYFLYFQGVGSYATVWLNGKKVGYHAGGLTTFTIDVTKDIRFDTTNVLAVRADHPAMITDLPWVCGGCSSEWGFSEGSEPMGIFRPVTLVVTNPTRIEPFGVHVWNDIPVNGQNPHFVLHMKSEVKNYGNQTSHISLISKLVNEDGLQVARVTDTLTLEGNESKTIRQDTKEIVNAHLWSISDPYLYHLITMIKEDGKVIDETTTDYGFRWISWPKNNPSHSPCFYLNGKQVFINGIAEYEDKLGDSHAFDTTEITARIHQIKSAGFNAFRGAHQPHNLLYQDLLNKNGLLFWSQFSAHIWYDTPEFQMNFLNNLKEWIKERRNSPSVILWGLQNESVLPYDFAKQCTAIIHQMDPTSPSQRLVTTCNGGTGTDWNVSQNWSGTYGGNPYQYGQDLKKEYLNGEYGAWRSIDLHAEGPFNFNQNGICSEDRMAQLLELKVKLAEQVKDSVCGQFLWEYNSNDNPGRIQNEEGYRDIDRIGPFNYKGLFTIWGEPVDAYYMYCSNYAPAKTEPMVYIVSHTWNNRWTKPGIKSGIIVYSNCDEVELFNDVRTISLGKRYKHGIGTHFQWNNVNIKYNVLYAVGYINNKPVAEDCIVLNHLPKAPHFSRLYSGAKNITKPAKGYHYIYRVNCGGPDYIDINNNKWLSDRHLTSNKAWGSLSWTDDFKDLPAFLASQRETKDPISGTRDWKLFQSFRYGLNRLRYKFPLPNGKYRVELYFIEPWYGIGGGINCTGYRVFDVGINGKTVIKYLDIWKEVGCDKVLKEVVPAQVTNGVLEINFPKESAGQAVISAIAIASQNKAIKAAPSSTSIMTDVKGGIPGTWLEPNAYFPKILPIMYGAEWIRPKHKNHTMSFVVTSDANIYIPNDTDYIKHFYKKGDTVITPGNKCLAVLPQIHWPKEENVRAVATYTSQTAELQGNWKKSIYKQDSCVEASTEGQHSITWTVTTGLANIYALRFIYMNLNPTTIDATITITDANGQIVHNDTLHFPPTPHKWKLLNTSTETFINAGHYTIKISGQHLQGLYLNTLQIQ